MDLLGKARKLESTIARKLDHAARELIGSSAREPIEVINLIVEAVQHEIQPTGRGRRVFPFNRIAVSITASSRDARARLEAILEGEPSLRERILERLRAARCETDVIVDVAYVGRPQKLWTQPDFHVDFHRDPRPRAAQTSLPPAGSGDQRGSRAAEAQRNSASSDAPANRIELVVVLGHAEQASYSLAADRINLGRSVEIRDRQHRLIRMNHVAFLERGGGVTESVSRQHAHIAFDAKAGHYRLHDDGSAHGTSIIRNGRSVAVPTGSRGVRLRSGDEIVLGDARLRVKLSF